MERNMDESRKQFLEFAEKQNLSLAYGDCGYVYSSTEMAWRAWQASRAAIEIKPISHLQAINAIPRSQTSLTDAVKIGYLICAESAGIKVKE